VSIIKMRPIQIEAGPRGYWPQDCELYLDKPIHDREWRLEKRNNHSRNWYELIVKQLE
jgi:hypothetical protein